MAMVMVMVKTMTTVQIDCMNGLRTDLHTHILPAFDDGAKDLETALQMLRVQKTSGVERVALTPHFYPMHEVLDAFVARRQQAYDALLSGYNGETMPQLLLGAEVRYTPQLTTLDLRQLTMGDGDYLLLELPDTRVPAYVEQVVDAMQEQGITPVLAHIDRCVYFQAEPFRLEKLIKMGALAQIDAVALRNRHTAAFASACFRTGLAHILASDTHNLTDRAPCLGNLVTKRNAELLAWTEHFAENIWENTPPPAFGIHSLKKGLLGYR